MTSALRRNCKEPLLHRQPKPVSLFLRNAGKDPSLFEEKSLNFYLFFRMDVGVSSTWKGILHLGLKKRGWAKSLQPVKPLVPLSTSLQWRKVEPPLSPPTIVAARR